MHKNALLLYTIKFGRRMNSVTLDCRDILYINERITNSILHTILVFSNIRSYIIFLSVVKATWFRKICSKLPGTKLTPASGSLLHFPLRLLHSGLGANVTSPQKPSLTALSRLAATVTLSAPPLFSSCSCRARKFSHILFIYLCLQFLSPSSIVFHV